MSNITIRRADRNLGVQQEMIQLWYFLRCFTTAHVQHTKSLTVKQKYTLKHSKTNFCVKYLNLCCFNEMSGKLTTHMSLTKLSILETFLRFIALTSILFLVSILFL